MQVLKIVLSQTPPLTISEEFIPHDVLQSQLFLLRMLSACMQHHWQFYRQSRKANSSSSSDLNLPQSPISTISREGSMYSGSIESGERWSSDGSVPSDLEDPPPLDDNLAKYIIAIMSRFMHQMSATEDGTNGNANSMTRTEYNAAITTGSSSDIMVDIYKAASRVVFYVSASNWPMMFGKIKARILYLSATMDENPEAADMRLLECSALNAKRLSMVMTGKCNSHCIVLLSFPNLVNTPLLRRAVLDIYASEKVCPIIRCGASSSCHLELDRDLSIRVHASMP